MPNPAIDYYHQLLTDRGLAEQTFEELHSGLVRNRLIFGGRPLSPYLRPHFITAAEWDLVKNACETVWSALQKVKDAAINDDALLDQLGIVGVERELVKIDPGYKHVSPTSRLDSFLSGDAYSFVELNGESPAGIAYSDAASEIFIQLPVMKKFTERYKIRRFEGRSKLLDVLLRCWDEFCGGRAETQPVIAIVDLRGLPTQKEFELFKDYFEDQGYNALICAPEDLEFDEDGLYFGGVKIDLVYKRLLVNEYLPIMDEYPALLEAYRAGTVCVVNSFRGKLVHKKAIFSILTDPQFSKLFNGAELEAIRKYVPWTRRLRPGTTDYFGETIDIIEWTRRNASQLVLKPNDDYGGHGIFIGWTLDADDWDEAIQTALANGDYLVQRRVKTSKEIFPMMLDDLGNWEMAEQLVDLDPLLFNGVVGSAFTRLSLSELANVSSGGGMVPTFVIE